MVLRAKGRILCGGATVTETYRAQRHSGSSSLGQGTVIPSRSVSLLQEAAGFMDNL